MSNLMNFFLPVKIRDAAALDHALMVVQYRDICTMPWVIYDAKNMSDVEFMKVHDDGSEMYKKCALSRNISISIQRIYAEYGYLDCMVLAFNDGHHCGESTCIAAASHGHVKCLEFANVHSSFKLNTITNICDIAAQNGHVRCVRYLLQNSCRPTVQTLAAAANMGQFGCVQYLLHVRCAWDATACTAAARHISCLRYMYRHELTWDESCTARAATNIQCLVFAHTHGCPWDEQTCINAAMAGNIECLVYALDNGCPHNENSLMLIV